VKKKCASYGEWEPLSPAIRKGEKGRDGGDCYDGSAEDRWTKDKNVFRYDYEFRTNGLDDRICMVDVETRPGALREWRDLKRLEDDLIQRYGTPTNRSMWVVEDANQLRPTNDKPSSDWVWKGGYRMSLTLRKQLDTPTWLTSYAKISYEGPRCDDSSP
jgi:hypothetical protein